MTKHPSIPVLDYPRDLYVGSFFYRSPAGICFCVGLAIASGIFLYLPLLASGTRTLRLMFGVGALMLGLAAVKFGIGILRDSRDVYKLTTAGIDVRGKLVPWSKILRLAADGKESSRFVRLFYTLQISAGMTSNNLLWSSSRLKKAEYEQLIAMLKNELSEAYPQLELGGYFSAETAPPPTHGLSK